MAFVGLIRMGFGMDWCRTLYAAWLALRAIQLWAPLPDNDPDGARARMRCFYALVRLSYGEPASPAKAAELEVDWWPDSPLLLLVRGALVSAYAALLAAVRH